MAEPSSIELVEWHDGVLSNIEIRSTDIILAFSRCYAYARTGLEKYEIVECRATLNVRGVNRLAVQGGLDLGVWLSDLEICSDGSGIDVACLLSGTGAGTLSGAWTNGTTIEAHFAGAKLTLEGPFTVVDEWVGPLISNG